MGSIKKLTVANFKSFRELSLDLDRLNVVIGANAAGKSNFVQILRFLHDVSEYGLTNAVSRQGGVKYTRNLRIGANAQTRISLVCETMLRRVIRSGTDAVTMLVTDVAYEFALEAKSRAERFTVVSDRIMLQCSFSRGREATQHVGNGTITFSNENGKIRFTADLPESVKLADTDFMPPFLKDVKLRPDSLLAEMRYSFLLFYPLADILASITAYDFDPRLARRSIQMTGQTELEADGSNLAIVLRDIWQDKSRRRKMSSLLREVLPAVSSWGVMTLKDTSLLLKMNEAFSDKTEVPASFLSDGTIHAVALLVALFFERNDVTVIEEPERNLHPSLMSRLVSLTEDASSKRQIIITTHNPEIVRHVGIDNLMLIERDGDGFSRIIRPKDVDTVGAFLANEIGIDELYISNLLRA